MERHRWNGNDPSEKNVPLIYCGYQTTTLPLRKRKAVRNVLYTQKLQNKSDEYTELNPNHRSFKKRVLWCRKGFVALIFSPLNTSYRRPWLLFVGKKMKWHIEINGVLNESQLSDWHDRTLVWMPAMVVMHYWCISLWCFQLPSKTLGSCVFFQTGSLDLLLISLHGFLQWHSHSIPSYLRINEAKRLMGL